MPSEEQLSYAEQVESILPEGPDARRLPAPWRFATLALAACALVAYLASSAARAPRLPATAKQEAENAWPSVMDQLHSHPLLSQALRRGALQQKSEEKEGEEKEDEEDKEEKEEGEEKEGEEKEAEAKEKEGEEKEPEKEKEEEEEEEAVTECEKETAKATARLLGGLKPEDLAKAMKPCEKGMGDECKDSIKKLGEELDEETKNKITIRTILECGLDNHGKECKESAKAMRKEVMEIKLECIKEGGKICKIHALALEKSKEPECILKQCLEHIPAYEKELSEEAGGEVEIRCHGHDRKGKEDKEDKDEKEGDSEEEE